MELLQVCTAIVAHLIADQHDNLSKGMSGRCTAEHTNNTVTLADSATNATAGR